MRRPLSRITSLVGLIIFIVFANLVLLPPAASLAQPSAPLGPFAPAPPPSLVNYQGTIQVGGTPYNGTGYFYTFR